MFKKWNEISLVKRIIIGLITGIALAMIAPVKAAPVEILGSLFVGALKAVAPILVFFLVMGAVSQHKSGQKTNMKSVISLYLIGTFLAGVVAVVGSFFFKITIALGAGVENVSPPSGVSEVLKTLLMNVVDNPVNALVMQTISEF